MDCLKLVFLVSLFVVADCWIPRRVNGRPKGGLLGAPRAPRDVKTPPAQWFTYQRLDHFDGANLQTWKQRYFVNDTFYQSGGPIFVMIGGEGPANPIWMVEGAWIHYAQVYGAICVMLEHRYYGESHPVKDLSTPNLKYLSSRQALADLAYFIDIFRLDQNLTNNKLITFGGSYPGSLSAWFRSKYPYYVDGAVATSAPIFAKVDFSEYLEVVDAALDTTTTMCNQEIRNATQTMYQWVGQPDKRLKLEQMFQLCDKIDHENILDLAGLFANTAGNFEGVVQYNKDNRAFEGAIGTNITIDTLCGIMTDFTIGSALDRYAKVNSHQYSQGSHNSQGCLLCFEIFRGFKSTMLEVLLNLLTVKTVLIGVSCGLLAALYLRTLRYKLPPGPMALPLVGNLLQCESKRLHNQMYEWSEKYGPVISVYMGPFLMIVVNDITTALEVLVKKSTDFAGRMKTPSTDAITDGGKDIAFGSYGPTWHIHRKLSSKALRMYMQGNNLDKLIHGALDVTLSEMDKVQGPFNPTDYINFLMGNILAGVCFGQVHNIDNKDVQRLLELEDESFKLLSCVVPEDFIPGLKYVYKSKIMKDIDRVNDGIVNQYIKRKFEEEKATFDRNNIRHFTDFLLLAKLEAAEEEGNAAVDSLSDDYLIQTCSDIFLAGIDTSRFTLAFAIRDMIIHPEIQEKVFDEINNVVGCGRRPQSSDRPQLAYTEAVLHESMRLNNVAPTGLAHVALCDSNINGYDVPKGTAVLINHWALHHRPDAWDQVDKFIPERFLDADGKLGPKPTSWLPFSAGKRVCLGEFVAKPELHLLFASLVQRFKWKPVPGVITDTENEGTFLVTYPKPFSVVLEKRF